MIDCRPILDLPHVFLSRFSLPTRVHEMVHYIRFLSTPQVSISQKRIIAISAPLAVTTDLGDAYLTHDVELLLRLVDTRSNTLLGQQKYPWKGGSRAVKTALQCDGKLMGRSVRVHVTTAETQKALDSIAIPKILDVWSSTFSLGDKVRSEPLVARQIPLQGGSTLCLWEETGDSIARHVWDAGLGFLSYFQSALENHPSLGSTKLHQLFEAKGTGVVRVLELGAGCGTAGIALSQILDCHTILTDLEDAMNILDTNIKHAAPVCRSPASASVLDWGTEVGQDFKRTYDLILVSDCIYNPDSSVQLVQTLLQITRASEALIVVGFKRRHSGDDVFFEHMSQSNFEVLETRDVVLPHLASGSDAYKPVIEFHIFKGPP